MAFDRLFHLFVPHPHNNHKAKTLHNTSLLALLGILLMVQSSISIFSRLKPGVLGYATQIPVDAVISLTNDMRKAANLPALKQNSDLTKAARAKAADMFAKGYWAHNAPDGTQPWFFINQSGYRYLHAGENLARDFSTAPAIVEAWMASPTHKANLLSSKYQDIGIAVVDGRLSGVETTLVVQMFGTEKASVPSVTSSNTDLVKPALAQGLLPLSTSPSLTPLDLSRSISLSFVFLIIFTLAIDWIVVWRRNIVRISGKNWAHLTFMATILIFIILVKQGLVL